MRHPNYVWMVHNWYNIDWWTTSSCTLDQMKAILNSQIVLDHFSQIDEQDKDKTNIGGVISEQATIN